MAENGHQRCFIIRGELVQGGFKVIKGWGDEVVVLDQRLIDGVRTAFRPALQHYADTLRSAGYIVEEDGSSSDYRDGLGKVFKLNVWKKGGEE
jgi:hypothetical protein